MITLSDKQYRIIFILAALWNLSFSITGLIFPSFTIKLAFGRKMDQSLLLGNYYAYSIYLFWWGAVFLFGIGYYIVSRDINKNRGIVWMAILGKLCFFFFFTYSYIAGKSAIPGLLGGAGDFVFTTIFVYFLWQTRDRT